jgi:hypothetical protein
VIPRVIPLDSARCGRPVEVLDARVSR